MSTPISQRSKLEGLELYAPRRARTAGAADGEAAAAPEAAEPEAAEPEAADMAPAPDEPPPQDGDRDALWESAEAVHARLEEAIAAAIDAGRSEADPSPAPADAMPARLAELRPPQLHAVDGRPSALDALPPRRRSAPPMLRARLDPELVPGPPDDAGGRRIAPMLVRFSLMVGFAALAAYGLTMISQPDMRWPSRVKDGIAATASKIVVARGERSAPSSRLVIEDQQVFANEPLPLGVSVDHAAADESLELDGLAAGTRLSAGVAATPSRWQISLHDLDHLYLYAPTDFVGVMNTAVDLLSANKTLLDSRAVRLEWLAKTPPPAQPAAAPSAPTPPAPMQPAPLQPAPPARDHPPSPATPLIGGEEAATLMKRGQDFLQTGDITAARIVFLRLADAGIADGAFAAAATYDPRYLAAHNVIGVRGDPAKARALYQRAAQLGSADAGRELARMEAK